MTSSSYFVDIKYEEVTSVSFTSPKVVFGSPIGEPTIFPSTKRPTLIRGVKLLQLEIKDEFKRHSNQGKLSHLRQAPKCASFARSIMRRLIANVKGTNPIFGNLYFVFNHFYAKLVNVRFYTIYATGKQKLISYFGNLKCKVSLLILWTSK